MLAPGRSLQPRNSRISERRHGPPELKRARPTLKPGLLNFRFESASDLLVVHNRPFRPHGLQPVGFDLELHNGLQLITLVEPPTQ